MEDLETLRWEVVMDNLTLSEARRLVSPTGMVEVHSGVHRMGETRLEVAMEEAMEGVLEGTTTRQTLLAIAANLVFLVQCSEEVDNPVVMATTKEVALEDCPFLFQSQFRYLWECLEVAATTIVFWKHL